MNLFCDVTKFNVSWCPVETWFLSRCCSGCFHWSPFNWNIVKWRSSLSYLSLGLYFARSISCKISYLYLLLIYLERQKEFQKYCTLINSAVFVKYGLDAFCSWTPRYVKSKMSFLWWSDCAVGVRRRTLSHTLINNLSSNSESKAILCNVNIIQTTLY